MSNQTTNTTQNDTVREYIKYYVKLNDPGYAVLLSGPWGSGKTWFVEDALKQIYKDANKAAKNYLFISLYGMTSFSDIENEFFRQLHPLLSSKAAQITGRLLKGVLKISTNIDVNGDGKSDVNVSGGIPSEDLFGKAGEEKNKLVIFDDLERCSIKLTDLLGYINQLVEKGGFRAILIGNEEEMTKPAIVTSKEPTSTAQSVDPLYLRIKEKLIGQTFQVRPEVDKAFLKFCDELPSETGKSVITKNASLTKEIYLAAGFNNLRGLRHSLMEFNRLCRIIDQKYLDHDKLMTELLAEFLCYSLIVRSGKLPAEKVSQLRSTIQIGHSQEQLIEEQQQIKDWLSRMPWVAGFTTLLNANLWTQIFAEGAFSVPNINEALGSSKHFQSKDTPNWVKLWHGRDLPDKTFKSLQSTVLEEWDGLQYSNEGEVLHVMGMLLEYGKDRLHRRSNQSLLKQGKKHLTKLSIDGKLVPSYDPFRSFSSDAFAGLGFQGRERLEFKELQNFLHKELQAIEERTLPALAEDLLVQLETDVNQFYLEISQNPKMRMSGEPQPIFKSMNVRKFVTKVSSMGGTDMYFIGGAIKKRFASPHWCKQLLDELSFLEKAKTDLKRRVDKSKGSMSGRNLTLHLLPELEQAIKNLTAASQEQG